MNCPPKDIDVHDLKKFLDKIDTKFILYNRNKKGIEET